MNNFLVMCALPYANGKLHLGHLLEYIQADIWTKYQKLFNNKVFFICGDDSHGTPILLKSKKKKINILKYINKIFKLHKNDLKNFNINFDYFSYSHHLLNYKFIKNIYKIFLYKKLFIYKNIKQYYDNKLNLFLADRYIKGTCNKCLTKNQNNDFCDICKIHTKLINPISILSKNIPIKKKTKHLFLNLSLYKNKIYDWLTNNIITNKHNINKLKEWFNKKLQFWDITRDNPYFGFNIPNYKKKFFYVWFTALLSYIGIFKNLCRIKKINFFNFWNKNSNNKIFYFIGKDIIYFHGIILPFLLEMLDYKKPNYIFTHGYITIKGNKISKSNNKYLNANIWLKYYDSDSLRYFYASKIINKNNDIEFNLIEFVNKINNDLVNKIINIASRSAKFINLYFNNITSKNIEDNNLLNIFISYQKKIKILAFKSDFRSIINIIMDLTNKANIYINNKKPWKLAKLINNKYNKDKLHNIATMGINMFRIIMIYLNPIIPNLIKKSELFLKTTLNWYFLNKHLINHKINKFNKLYVHIKINNNLFKNNI